MFLTKGLYNEGKYLRIQNSKYLKKAVKASNLCFSLGRQAGRESQSRTYELFGGEGLVEGVMKANTENMLHFK